MTTCMGQTRMKMTMEHRPPLEILAELRAIEQEILQGIEELEGMLR
jgi:type I restriction enzyme M protein